MSKHSGKRYRVLAANQERNTGEEWYEEQCPYTDACIFYNLLQISYTLSAPMPLPYAVRRFLCVAAIVFSVMAPAAQAEPSRQPFPVISLSAGIHAIQAEVAATEQQRQQGLMYRESMAPNAGMLFLFGASAGVCMWMKDTLIPLSAAFIDADGRIVNIEEMSPRSLQSHCGRKPVAYVLEMNKGWFQQRNIKPGTVISGLPPLSR